MADHAPPPALLSLETLTQHDRIVIDQVSYNLRNIDELSIVDAAKAAKLGRRLEALGRQGLIDISEDEASELDQALSIVTRMVLDAPADVLAALSFTHRFRIAQAFTTRQSTPPGTRTGAPVASQPTRRTGARSSRGSCGSMARRRATG